MCPTSEFPIFFFIAEERDNEKQNKLKNPWILHHPKILKDFFFKFAFVKSTTCVILFALNIFYYVLVIV